MFSKNTITLFIILALIAILFFVFDNKKNDQNIFFTQIDSKNISKLKIKKNSKSYEIYKNKNWWEIKKPIKDRANNALINNFISEISELKIIEKINRKEKLVSRFGLDKKNAFYVTIENQNKKTQILLGHKGKIPNSIYGAHPKNKKSLFLVQFNSQNSLPDKLNNLRDDSLLHLKENQILNIALRDSIAEIVISRKHPSLPWKIRKPLIAIADKQKISKFISNFKDTKIINFISDAEAIEKEISFPQDNFFIKFSSQEITNNANQIKNNNNSTSALRFGKYKQNSTNAIYVRDLKRPGVFEVNPNIKKSLVFNPNFLRSKKISNINPKLINAIIIQNQKKENLYLAKIDTQWLIGPILDNYKTANSNTINQFLKKISSDSIKNFINIPNQEELKNYKLDNPFLNVKLTAIDQDFITETNLTNPNKVLKEKEIEKITKIILFSKNENKFYAHEFGTQVVYELNENILNEFTFNTSKWKSLNPIEFLPTRFEHAVIQYKNKNNIMIKKNIDTDIWQAFKLDNKNEKPTDYSSKIITKNANKFLDTISSIVAIDCVEIDEKINDKLKKPSLQINLSVNTVDSRISPTKNKTISFSPADTVITLKNYKKTLYYMNIDDSPFAYLIEKKIYDNLNQEFLID